MNTKNEPAKKGKVENPMQERPSVIGNEKDVLAAEEILSVRKLDAQEESGQTPTMLFVP